jgi:Na+-driven multidrug efflux pump
MAKLSSFKSLLMGVILSVFITALLFIMGDELPKWLTPDPTLQNMLNDVIPMIGMANVFMVFGMVAWTLIGAQGRYKLATIISLCMTIFITMPLAAISTFYFVYDLKGIVGSIICGYSTTGLCLGYILLTSDWEHISENIQECNRQYESSDSESESDSLGNDDNVALPSFD